MAAAGFKKGRVTFQYETEVNGAKKTVKLPHRTLVLGDFAEGCSKEAKKDFEERKALSLQPGKLDELIESMGIEIKMEVDDHMHEEGGKMDVKIPVHGMKDFHPDEIVKSVPDLKQVFQFREQLKIIRDKTKGPKKFSKLLKQLGVEAEESS